MTDIAWILAALALLVQTGTLIGAVAWKLSSLKTELVSAIAAHREEIDGEFQRRERMVGETVAAVRQKIQDVELYVRDHFVQKESFDRHISELAADLRNISDKVDARFDKIDSKIDRLTEARPS